MENSFLLEKLQGNFPAKINEIQDAHNLLTIVVDTELLDDNCMENEQSVRRMIGK